MGRTLHILRVTLLLVLPLVEVADLIMQCRGGEASIGEYLYVALPPPAYVAFAARFLRTDVWEELLIGGEGDSNGYDTMLV